MARPIYHLIVAGCLLMALCGTSPARADEPAEQVRKALNDLDGWLGPQAPGWHMHLRLDPVAAALDQPSAAAAPALAASLARFDAPAAGLSDARFANLRLALRNWHNRLAAPAPAELAESVRAAKSSFVPVSEADTAAAAETLRGAVAKLNAVLTGWGATGAAWRTYLGWDELAAQAAAGPKADVRALRAAVERLGADHEGLERAEFAAARDAAAQLADALEAVATADLAGKYQAELDALAASVEQYGNQPTEEQASSIGSRLRWLRKHRQAGPLIQAIRRRHEQPNLYVSASREFLAAGLERPVDDVAPVHDLILGTSIHGMGRTVGNVQVRLVPDPHRATVETLLAGHTYTNTVGYNGPAIIHSRGTTQVSALKRIVFDANGPAEYPATAWANTNTTITGVDANRGGCIGRIIERVASKRAAASQSEAEYIAGRHAEDRLRQRVNAESARTLADARANYFRKVRNPLLRRRAFPARLDFSTSGENLFVTALAAEELQLGAPADPPELSSPRALNVRLHESTVNNLCGTLLAGFTLTEEELQAKVIEWRGSLPESLKTDEDRGPWSITFAQARPVTISLADGGFTVTIRGQRYTSSDRQFKAMNVTARYQVQRQGTVAKLVRQGELEIFPPGFVPGKSTLTPGDISLKRILERKFNKLFAAEIVSEGFQLKGKWEHLGKLPLETVSVQQGWAVLGWGLRAAEAAKVAAVEPR